jgi:hypothetical protein
LTPKFKDNIGLPGGEEVVVNVAFEKEEIGKMPDVIVK